MSDIGLLKYNSMTSCPFCKVPVLAGRLMIHKARCPRRLDGLMEVCPHNPGHIVHITKMSEHIQTCPDRKIYEELISMGPSRADIPLAVQKPEENLTGKANWDAQPDCGTYDWQTYCNQNKVIVCHKGLSKSEKKRLREEQRQKFRETSP